MLFSSNTFYFFEYSFYGSWGIWNYFTMYLLPFGPLSSTMAVGKKNQLTETHHKSSQDRNGEFIFPEKLIWWEVPAVFNIKNTGKTLVTRTQQAKLYLITSRVVFKVSLAYLPNNGIAFRKLKIITKNVLVKNLLCISQEMYFVIDRICFI